MSESDIAPNEWPLMVYGRPELRAVERSLRVRDGVLEVVEIDKSRLMGIPTVTVVERYRLEKW